MGLFDRFKKTEPPKQFSSSSSGLQESPRAAELPPCPVCGAKAVLDKIGDTWIVGCPNYTVFDKVHKVGEDAPVLDRFRLPCADEETAISVWNARVKRYKNHGR